MTFIPGQRPVAPWRFHHWWGQWNSVGQLPNVAGSAAQYNAEIQAGDLAWVTADSKLYVCVDPTPGAATWAAVSSGGSGNAASWEWKFSGSVMTTAGTSSVTFSDGTPTTSQDAATALIQYPVSHDETVTIDKLVLNIIANTSLTEGVFTVIKNGAPTGITIHVPAGATGFFAEAIPTSITVTKPDVFGLLLQTDGGGVNNFIGGTAALRMSLP